MYSFVLDTNLFEMLYTPVMLLDIILCNFVLWQSGNV